MWPSTLNTHDQVQQLKFKWLTSRNSLLLKVQFVHGGMWQRRPVQDWFLSPVTTELCIVWGWCSYSNNFPPLCSSSPTALQHLSSQLDYIPRSGPKYISSTYCWAPTSSKTVLSSVPSPIIPVCSDTSPLTFYGSALTAGKNGHSV